MKHITLSLTICGILFLENVLYSQQQTELPIGIYLFGRNADYKQMCDSLNLTWVQDWTGNGSYHTGADTNSYSLKVITIRDGLDYVARSQKMEYQAERTWPSPDQSGMYNFFGEKQTGEPDGNAWRCRAGIHPAGSMVRDPRPNSEFYYNAEQYYATFSMKVNKGTNPNDTVAILRVICLTHGDTIGIRTLLDEDFLTGGTYYNFEIPFRFQKQQAQSTNPPKFLKGREIATISDITCKSIDIEVDWRGNRTTWLDYVIVEDSIANILFKGGWDSLIQNDVIDYVTGYPLMQRFYHNGEPYVPAFLPFRYLDNKLRTWFPETRGRSFADNYWRDVWIRRFVQDAQPNEVVVDYYRLKANVPSPSMTNDQATSVGVVTYISNAQYNDSLQKSWDDLSESFSTAANLGKPLWYVPQLHGEYIVNYGGFVNELNCNADTCRKLRPPIGAEIQAQINIALSFGAKGIIAYPFGTDYIPNFDAGSDGWMTGLVSKYPSPDGKYRDHWSDITTLPGPLGDKLVYTGYKEKWNAFNQMNIKLKTITPTLLSLNWQGTRSIWKQDKVYGSFNIITTVSTKNTSGATDQYPAVVIGQFYQIADTNYIYVVNRRCDTKNNNMDTRDISMTLSTVRQNWLITDVLNNKGYVVAGGGIFTDRFNPGEGKLYKLENAVISNTRFFNSLTVNNGAKLTTITGSQINIGYQGSITVNGSLDATGTTFSSKNRYKGSWERINLYGGPNTIKYCNVTYANWGIYINNTSNNTIENCGFDSCINAGVYAISSNRNKGACTIKNSTFSNMSTRGIGIINGRADITNIYAQGNSQGLTAMNSIVYLDHSRVQYNTSRGIYISGSTASIYLCADDFLPAVNKFLSNAYGEVYITSSGWAYIGNYDAVKGIQYGGSNCITNSGGTLGKLVYHAGRDIVLARKNYWGSDTTNGFYGQVDHSYVLTSSPCLTLDYGEGFGEIPKEEDIKSLIKGLVQSIGDNAEDASSALRQLAGLIGAGSTYSGTLDITWEQFLSDIINSANIDSTLRSIATAYYIQTSLEKNQYTDVISMCNSILENKPDDNLWFYCKSVILFANVYLNKIEEAYSVLASIEENNHNIIPEDIKILEEFIDAAYTSISDQSSGMNKTRRSNRTDVERGAPDRFILQQNYPNPFNPTTRFDYAIPTDEYVTLKIYDVLGREVATVVDELQNAGYKSIEFNASKLPSGMYFYRLQAGRFTDVKKMLLVR